MLEPVTVQAAEFPFQHLYMHSILYYTMYTGTITSRLSIAIRTMNATCRVGSKYANVMIRTSK